MHLTRDMRRFFQTLFGKTMKPKVKWGVLGVAEIADQKGYSSNATRRVLASRRDRIERFGAC